MTANNGFATRDDFLGATKRRFREVALPGGKRARIRSLTAGEWADIETKHINLKGGGLNPVGLRNSDFRLIISAVVDGEGQPLFSDADIDKLAAADSALVQPLVREIREHCGLRGDVEGAIKNSDSTTGEDSPSSFGGQPEPQASTV